MAASAVSAQTLNQGSQPALAPNTSIHGSDIDIVSLSNGALHIEIPILEVVERGHKLRWAYIYDSPVLNAQFIPVPTATDKQAGFWHIVDPVNATWGNNWRLADPFGWRLYYETIQIDDNTGNALTCLLGVGANGNPIYDNYELLQNYQLVDPQGRVHPTGLFQNKLTANNVAPPSGTVPSCTPIAVTTSPAYDGSGEYVDANANTVRLKDGALISLGTSYLDANGNTTPLGTDLLGRNLVATSASASGTTISVHDASGTIRQYQVTTVGVPVSTNDCPLLRLPPDQPCTELTETWGLVSQLTLPNGTSYQFQYAQNSHAEVLSMTLPTGGSIAYTYSGMLYDNTGNNLRVGLMPGHNRIGSRSVTDASGTHTRQYNIGLASGGTMTDPLGNCQNHVLTRVLLNSTLSSPVETQVLHYNGACTGTAILTVNTDYAGDGGTINNKSAVINVRSIRVTTTLDNGLSKKVETDYDSASPSTGATDALNPSEIREFDYGATSPTRVTDYTYLHDVGSGNVPASTYQSLNIVDRPLTVKVYSGANLTTPVSQTQYEYDNYTLGITSTNNTAANHNSTFNSSYISRGNLTAVLRWRNTDGAWLTTRYQYDDLGNRLSVTDPLNNTTSFSYTDAWSESACPPISGVALSYPTTVTNALGHQSKKTYSSCTGLIASTRDPNDLAASRNGTQYSYDMFNRPISVSFPDGGQSTTCYSDIGGSTCSQTSAPFQVFSTKAITTTPLQNLQSNANLDVLGRVVQTHLTSDPGGTTHTFTTYDALSRPSQVYNPTRCNPPTTNCGEPTWGYTTHVYDALGRECVVVPPDGTAVTNNVCPSTQPANDVFTSYSGNTATVTDHAGKTRKSVTDGLGRLTQVFEDPGSSPHLNYETDYTYDVLDNLLTVTQKGGTTDSTQWRTRTFVYNSLSQLVSAGNPESGSITYIYDNAGNLSTKTDARNIRTNYSYDSLNRLTIKSYSDQGTPVAYLYDGQTPPSATPTSGTGTVIISGSEQSKYVCNPSCDPTCRLKSCATLVYDSGNIATTVNGFTKSVSFGKGSTSNSIALAITNAFNGDTTSPVTASVSGAIVTLTAKTSGSASNYSLSASTTSFDSTDFAQASFVPTGFGFTLTGGCNTDGSLTVTNGIGRRTGMCDAAGAEAWAYDPMGRVTVDQRNTNSVTKTASHTYNLDGSLANISYPSGRTITYAPGAAGRPLSAIDSTGPINYALNATYAPQGALASLQNGGSVYSTFLFNNRLQPCWLYTTTSSTGPPTSCTQTGVVNASILDYQYDFGLGVSDNGNVNKITNRRDPTRSQNFSYDSLNRISTAQTQTTGVTIPNPNCWGLTFGYDPWGNLLTASTTGPAGCPEPLPLSVSAATSNRISGYCYDSAGNMLDPGSCPTGSNPHAYTYNAENQLTSAGGMTYTYDGDGKRVQKSNGKLYWYGMGSDPLDETDAQGNTNNSSFFEYAFFNGKRIARRDYQNNVNYYFADHLGTARVNTNSSGAICYDADFYPFGGERIVTDTCDSAYKFTGKERDSESGLDNFGKRYYGSTFGRFVSPDAKGVSIRHLLNPQKLNKYSYVLNNPLAFFDPNGMEEVTIQFRAFIPQASVGGFRGDNRTFSSDKNASSRVSVTVKIETDPAKNHGNPLIGQPEVKISPTHNNITGGERTSSGPQTPQVTATQDKNGNVDVHLQENMRNPYQPIGQGIKADVNMTVPQDASTISVQGTISGSPAFEVNTQVDGGAIENLPLQNASSDSLGFVVNLQLTNTVDVKQKLDDPNKEDKELKKKKGDQQ